MRRAGSCHGQEKPSGSRGIYRKAEAIPNIAFHLGAHDEKDFTDTDMVIMAAGVPLASPFIAAARAAGVPVYMSTALAAKFACEQGATVVGVTGTRGKTTAAAMIHHALRLAGTKVHIGGNIRGVSTLSLLPEVTPGSILVLELDSWQIAGVRAMLDFAGQELLPRLSLLLLADVTGDL
jgi:UDP-N-acetylmuramoylalanine--D-glutamate ligase